MSTDSPDFTTDDPNELDAALTALKAAGVEYDTDHTFRVKFPDEPASNDSEPSDEYNGRSLITNIDRSEDGRAVVQAIATHPRGWVNSNDIDPDTNRPVTQVLSELHRGNVLVRRERTRNNCQYEYRLKDAYRREADLMEGSA